MTSGNGRAAASLDLNWFRSQLGSRFQVDVGSDQVSLHLVEAAEGRPGGGFERFSILFHGPGDRLLDQGIYEFHHSSFDPFSLFIVPIIGSNAERAVYEAVFSRRVTT